MTEKGERNRRHGQTDGLSQTNNDPPQTHRHRGVDDTVHESTNQYFGDQHGDDSHAPSNNGGQPNWYQTSTQTKYHSRRETHEGEDTQLPHDVVLLDSSAQQVGRGHGVDKKQSTDTLAGRSSQANCAYVTHTVNVAPDGCV